MHVLRVFRKLPNFPKCEVYGEIHQPKWAQLVSSSTILLSSIIRVQWNFFKKRKERTKSTCSFSLSISPYLLKWWESFNISHDSSLLRKIILHYDSILLKSLPAKWAFSLANQNGKGCQQALLFSLFPPDAKFLHVSLNQKYWKIRKEGEKSSTDMYMNQRRGGGVRQKGGREGRRRESQSCQKSNLIKPTLKKKQKKPPCTHFFLKRQHRFSIHKLTSITSVS